jgi:hypothetical protein
VGWPNGRFPIRKRTLRLAPMNCRFPSLEPNGAFRPNPAIPEHYGERLLSDRKAVVHSSRSVRCLIAIGERQAIKCDGSRVTNT